MSTDFVSLTEISGDDVAVEQVERLARRYYWAGEYCRGKDVLEAACGAGQGVGYILNLARSLTAGDVSEPLLSIAGSHYGTRIDFQQFDAQEMPFPDRAFDVVILFEALYYLPSVSRFLAECHRVLRPGGTLLVATANKDLYDFNPSEHSHCYLGVVELNTELSRHGFHVECFGDTPVGAVSPRQRVLRPIKAIASRAGIIPKSMRAKKLLKRFVFGGLVPMPAEITSHTAPMVPPTPLDVAVPDKLHKVIFCAASVA